MSCTLRSLSLQFAAGGLLGLLFISGLVTLDVARLSTVISGSETPWLPLALLFANAAGLFGTVVAASASVQPASDS